MSPGVLLEDPFTGIIRGTIAVEIHRGDPDVFVVAAEAADPTEYGAGQFAPIDGSGAALTYEDAHAAAVGECLERWALTVVHPEDIVLASYDELAARGLPATEPGRWALFDPRQLGHVPFSPFAGDTPIGWVWAESLTRRRECLVPACLVYLPYVPARSDRGERIIAPSISTGTACAPSRSEALLKGCSKSSSATLS